MILKWGGDIPPPPSPLVAAPLPGLDLTILGDGYKPTAEV